MADAQQQLITYLQGATARSLADIQTQTFAQSAGAWPLLQALMSTGIPVAPDNAGAPKNSLLYSTDASQVVRYRISP